MAPGGLESVYAVMTSTPTPAVRIERPHMPDSEKMIRLPIDVRLKVFDRYLTPTLRAQVEEEFGVWRGQPQYPVLVGNRLLDVLCTALPDRSPAEARQMLGYEYVAQYRHTVLGWLMLVVRPMLDLDWVLRGLPRQYAGATNYGTYWVAPVGERHWRFDFEDDPGDPDWILGTLLAGGTIFKVRGLSISHRILAPQHMSFSIQWA
jgi:uncharacterized protein (TIGR02265 family)